jgi:hypothetical protein
MGWTIGVADAVTPGFYFFRTHTQAAEVCRVQQYGSEKYPERMAYFTDGARNKIEELTPQQEEL